MPENRTITKALGAQEDLLFGEGEATQVRNGQTVTVNKIRNFYPVNSEEELLALDGDTFPKAVLVTSTEIIFYTYNGVEYVEVPIKVDLGEFEGRVSALEDNDAIQNTRLDALEAEEVLPGNDFGVIGTITEVT